MITGPDASQGPGLKIQSHESGSLCFGVLSQGLHLLVTIFCLCITFGGMGRGCQMAISWDKQQLILNVQMLEIAKDSHDLYRMSGLVHFYYGSTRAGRQAYRCWERAEIVTVTKHSKLRKCIS